MIILHEGWTDHNMALFMPYQVRLEQLLAHWVQRLTLRFAAQGDDSDDTICVIMQPEYRRMTVEVYGRFWSLSDTERIWEIHHEIHHAHLGILTEWIERRLLPLVPVDQEFLTSEYNDRLESAIESLVFTLHNVEHPRHG